MPMPIATAPTDGTVILTDCGFVVATRRRKWLPTDPDFEWVECDPSGHAYECADNGLWYCNPKLWEPVPEWVTARP